MAFELQRSSFASAHRENLGIMQIDEFQYGVVEDIFIWAIVFCRES